MVTSTAFRPGAAVGIVAPWFVAVVPMDGDVEFGTSLTRLAAEPAGGLDDLVQAVTAMDLRSLPAFALAVVELNVVSVLLRGPLAARSEGPQGVVVRDGAGFRTWREWSVERPVGVRIGLPDALDGAATFWTTGGVVPVAAIEVVSTLGSQASAWPERADGAAAVGAVGANDEAAGRGGSPTGGPEPVPMLAEIRPGIEPVADPLSDAQAAADANHVGESEPEPLGVPVPVPGPEPESESEPELGRVTEPEGVAEPASGRQEPEGPRPAVDPPADEAHDLPSAATLLPSALGDDPYADLWLTKVGSVEDAAVRTPQVPGTGNVDAAIGPIPGPVPRGVGASDPASVEPGPLPSLVGDHDGRTRSVHSILAELGTDGNLPDAAGPGGGADGVPASLCINDHPNPPFAVTCRRCLAPVREEITRVPRADAGVLVLPDGRRIEVDRTIVIGRNPKAEGIYAGDPPRLVTIAEDDVSRTHLVVELSGWTATVSDKDSRNGTDVQLPGKLPEQLRPHTPTAIVIGTRIVLAGDVVLKLEGG